MMRSLLQLLTRSWLLRLVAAALACAMTSAAHAAAWEPARPVEFIVPAGAGGASDQMARMIQSIVQKHQLMKQPI